MRHENLTMQSSEDEESLRELDKWLRSRAHSQEAIKAKIAEHSEQALRKIIQSDDYIDRLAGILEDHGFASDSQYWADEEHLAKDFWDRVSRARLEKERRINTEHQIRAALPKGMFDHYEWYRLANHSLSALKCVLEKCSNWESWRYLLNWAMLHRDKGYRDNWQKFRNTAVLIGQHHHHSAIKKASSPVEKKDIICVKLWLDEHFTFESNKRNRWEWDRAATIKYMRTHQLTFDDNGFIIPRTGSFNESMVEQILFLHSRATLEITPISQGRYNAHIQPVHAPHVGVLPPSSAKHKAARQPSVYPQMPSFRPSLSSTFQDECTEAHSRSPTCDSSPGVGEVEADRNIGISEASSTPRDHIESSSRQEPFDIRRLTPPSSAGGLVQGGWKQYAKMIDDVTSSIKEDQNLCHIGVKKNVLDHLQNARELCMSQGEEEFYVEQE
ncbi:hypothetical protein Q7P35_008973 [Cladosporium inversicolor]